MQCNSCAKRRTVAEATEEVAGRQLRAGSEEFA